MRRLKESEPREMITAHEVGVFCRLLNSHKWERMQTPTVEAYRCRRCGKRHYGPIRDPNMAAMTGGGGG
jgi:hypothetical protein